MDEMLFREAALSDFLDAQIRKMRGHVANLTPEQMNGASDDEIVAHVVSVYRVEPLTVNTDSAEADHAETSVDISGSIDHLMPDRSRPFLVKANRITLYVPFMGDPELLRFRPSSHKLTWPRGRVKKQGQLAGTILMSLALPTDLDEKQFNDWIKEQLGSLIFYSERSHCDVEAFNKRLERDVQIAVTDRRRQLEKQGSLLQKLSVPLRRRDGAPPPIPVPMPKRLVKPLPPPRRVEQEYGISDADYEFILQILRHESRSFEATPDAFIKLDEEELRDVVLAHLNGHFQGSAAGERFRKKGKTDICIEYENRAAFVAECKIWKGPKVLNEAIDQLLGYLTWRDTKVTLLLWNKSIKDFSTLQSSMPELLRHHLQFARTGDSGHSGEWRAVFRAIGDDGREITVHVFLVDLADRASEVT